MFPRYDSYEEYQHERLKREEYRKEYEKRESERAKQRERQRQKAIVSTVKINFHFKIDFCFFSWISEARTQTLFSFFFINKRPQYKNLLVYIS